MNLSPEKAASPEMKNGGGRGTNGALVKRFPLQALDDDVSGAISFEELRDGLARLTFPPVRISFDDWEHMTRGFTVKEDGEDGEELLDQHGFHRLLRQVCVTPARQCRGGFLLLRFLNIAAELMVSERCMWCQLLLIQEVQTF